MLRRGPPYASASFLGAVYAGPVGGLDVRKVAVQILAVPFILLVPGVTQWRGWGSPEPRDLTPAVLREKGDESPDNRANTPRSSDDSGDPADASGGIDQGERA
jgi:hypothetical protein